MLSTARAGKISARGIVNVLTEVCTNIARSRLARVLLKTQVMATVTVMAKMVKVVMPRISPPPDVAAQDGERNSGRCHSAHRTPRMSVPRSGPCNRSRRGSAKPRQPLSSNSGPPKTTRARKT